MSKESGPVSMAAKGIARPAKAAAALSLCFTMTGVNAQDHPSERPAGDSGALATAVPEGMWEDSPATAKEQETGGLPGVEPQAETLDSLVVSATRIRTPASELTQSVTVVAGEEIAQQKRIDRNVGEILSKSVPGFSQSTEGLTDFGQTLRGRTFLTLIDGVPMSTPLRDGRRSLNTIDADAIERIEVVRGGTAVYGFGASGGLVNASLRRDRSMAAPRPGSRVPPRTPTILWNGMQAISYPAIRAASAICSTLPLCNATAFSTPPAIAFLLIPSVSRAGSRIPTNTMCSARPITSSVTAGESVSWPTTSASFRTATMPG